MFRRWQQSAISTVVGAWVAVWTSLAGCNQGSAGCSVISAQKRPMGVEVLSDTSTRFNGSRVLFIWFRQGHTHTHTHLGERVKGLFKY